MALDYDTVMSKVETDLPFSYTDTETILYAIAVGMGRDPLDARELPYVYEQGEHLKSLPTLATVLVPEMFPVGLGWDYSQILHSEQRMRLYRPLPPAGNLLINKRVVDVFDRGPKLGALVLLEAEGRLASDDTVLFTLGCTIVARGIKTSLSHAALINGSSSHALDYDDVNQRLHGHPTVAPCARSPSRSPPSAPDPHPYDVRTNQKESPSG